MTSKGLKTINYKYMKKLIEKIKAKFSRKPLMQFHWNFLPMSLSRRIDWLVNFNKTLTF